MTIEGENSRTDSRMNARKWGFACLLILLATFVTTRTASSQKPPGPTSAAGPLTVDEVVGKMIAMNLRRAQALHSYHGTRTYQAEYRSSLKTLSAQMVVDVNYRAPHTKQFTIKSTSGSKLILDKVFRKILQAEEDALSTDAQRSSALNWENYSFKLLGYENTTSLPKYVLAVEPRTDSKFLFRGRIWIGATDFAVMRIEAEPAKNPSFWTRNNEIEQSYKKVDDFWLPERNYSISSIRIGGRAKLIIEYQNYEITAADPVANPSEHEVAQSVNPGNQPEAAKLSHHPAAEAGALSVPVSDVKSHHPLTDRLSMVPQVHNIPAGNDNPR